VAGVVVGPASPAFVSSTTAYTSVVQYAASSVTVTAPQVDPTSTVTINGVPCSGATCTVTLAINPGACRTVTVVVTVNPSYAPASRTYTMSVCRLSMDQQLGFFTYTRALSTPIIANDGVPDLWSVSATSWANSGTNIPASQIAQMNVVFRVFRVPSNPASLLTSGSVAILGGSAAFGLSPNNIGGQYVLLLQEIISGLYVPIAAGQPTAAIQGLTGILYSVTSGFMDIRTSTVEYFASITLDNLQYFIRARDRFGNVITDCANTIPVADLVFDPPGSTASCLNGLITVRFFVPVAGTYTLRVQYLGVDIGTGKGLIIPPIREQLIGGLWSGLGDIGGFRITIVTTGISAANSYAVVNAAGYSPVGVAFQVFTRNQDSVFSYEADTVIIIQLVNPATGLPLPPGAFAGYLGSSCFTITPTGSPTYNVRYTCGGTNGIPMGTYTLWIQINPNNPLKPLGGNIGGGTPAGTGYYTLLVSNPLANVQDTYLERLQISPGQYSPLFSQTVTTYTAYVQFTQTDMTVIASSLIASPSTRLYIENIETTRRTILLNTATFTTSIRVRLV
jgi:hypothetical protein